MILNILITTFATAILFVLGSVRFQSRELLIIALITGVYIVHCTHRIFDGLGGNALEYTLLVNSAFYILYLPLILIFLFRSLGQLSRVRISRIAAALAVALFIVIYYAGFIERSMKIFAYSNLIWHLEIISLIVIAQYVWQHAATVRRTGSRLFTVHISIVQTWLVCLLTPYFISLAVYALPPDNFLIPYSPSVTGELVTQLIIVIVLARIFFLTLRFRNSIETYRESNAIKGKIKDLAF
jgi:hypothetical protein